jgi:hypothetical protein
MIRTTTSKVDFDFSTRSLAAGDLTLDYGLPSAEPPMYPRAHLSLDAVAAVKDGTPDKSQEVGVLHTTLADLRRFCKDTLHKLDEAEGTVER